MDKGKLQQNILILSSSYYWEQITYIEKYLLLSRSPDTFLVPHKLFLLQRDIIFSLRDLEQTIRESKKTKEIEKGDTSKEEVYAREFVCNKALVNVIQSIADGLAWRILNFDRAFIRVMSAPKKPRGSVDFSVAYPGMEDVAIRLMYENGSRVVFNDVTHYLRLGDLTEFLPSGEVIIHELKRSGKKIKNAHTIANQQPKAGISKQMQNVVLAQTAFNERKIIVDNKTVPFDDIDLPFANNLVAIGNLISEARTSYFARTKFGNYLEVYCMDFKATISNSLKHEPPLWKQFDFKSSFKSSDLVADVDNWDSWYEEGGDFTRNKTPYSIYPFSVSACMGLISGELQLMSRLNFSELHRIYGANGWDVSAFGKEYLQKQYQLVISKRRPNEIFNPDSSMEAFTISRNGFNMALPLALLLQVATDFIKPELLLAMAEDAYNTSERGVDRTSILSITSEKDVWI